MKIVMIHDWCVEWAASGTDTHPIEYASTEQAILDFEALARETRAAFYAQTVGPRESRFSFAGKKFDALDFFPRGQKSTEIELPEFLTVDEWFQKHGSQSG
jgi:hypothetical protein